MGREVALDGELAAESSDPLERRRRHDSLVRSACGQGGQHICNEVAHASEELSAHPRMEAIAIRTAEREQADGAFFSQRDEGHGAHIVCVRAKEELAL